jgi:hypothetical protein
MVCFAITRLRRQGEEKPGPLSFTFAFHPQPAPVLFDVLFRKGQAEAGPLEFSLRRCLRLFEGQKNPFEVVRRDPYTGIGNADKYLTSLPGTLGIAGFP